MAHNLTNLQVNKIRLQNATAHNLTMLLIFTLIFSKLYISGSEEQSEEDDLTSPTESGQIQTERRESRKRKIPLRYAESSDTEESVIEESSDRSDESDENDVCQICRRSNAPGCKGRKVEWIG